MAMNLPSQRGRGRRGPMAEINVTPLVDVMLVLLIIFMVTAPLLTAGVQVNLPESKAEPLPQERKPIQVTIDQGGQIFLDDAAVADADLAARLAQVVAAAPKSPDGKAPQVFLRADQGLGYGKVIRVMGDLNHAGLNRISLVNDPEGQR